jgi:transcriptional regulator with XRE-family HTH domain
MISLGEFLKNARTRAGLKQIEVEKKTGISNKSLSNWENNVSKPTADDLITLSNLYCMSMDALVGKQSPQPQKPTLADALPVVGNIIKMLAALSPQKQEQAASYIAFLAQDDKKA